MKANFNPTWTTCLFLVLLAFVAVRSNSALKSLEERITALEKKAQATVEIRVERAFDADMGVYDYQLIGKSGKATPIKRGRKRMSQLREDY